MFDIIGMDYVISHHITSYHIIQILENVLVFLHLPLPFLLQLHGNNPSPFLDVLVPLISDLHLQLGILLGPSLNLPPHHFLTPDQILDTLPLLLQILLQPLNNLCSLLVQGPFQLTSIFQLI
jgi:hypothetical protein